jgi:hypothetical protein
MLQRRGLGHPQRQDLKKVQTPNAKLEFNPFREAPDRNFPNRPSFSTWFPTLSDNPTLGHPVIQDPCLRLEVTTLCPAMKFPKHITFTLYVYPLGIAIRQKKTIHHNSL